MVISRDTRASHLIISAGWIGQRKDMSMDGGRRSALFAVCVLVDESDDVSVTVDDCDSDGDWVTDND